MSWTRRILAAVADRTQKRRDVALLYRAAVADNDEHAMPAHWPIVNTAIRKRWSLSGLNWIKREAWRRPVSDKGSR